MKKEFKDACVALAAKICDGEIEIGKLGSALDKALKDVNGDTFFGYSFVLPQSISDSLTAGYGVMAEQTDELRDGYVHVTVALRAVEKDGEGNRSVYVKSSFVTRADNKGIYGEAKERLENMLYDEYRHRLLSDMICEEANWSLRNIISDAN